MNKGVKAVAIIGCWLIPMVLASFFTFNYARLTAPPAAENPTPDMRTTDMRTTASPGIEEIPLLQAKSSQTPQEAVTEHVNAVEVRAIHVYDFDEVTGSFAKFPFEKDQEATWNFIFDNLFFVVEFRYPPEVRRDKPLPQAIIEAQAGGETLYRHSQPIINWSSTGRYYFPFILGREFMCKSFTLTVQVKGTNSKKMLTMYNLCGE